MLAPTLRRLAVMAEGLGNGRSGMFIELGGADRDGKQARCLWELIAHDNKGQNIPCMATVALVRKLTAGNLSVRGAMPCIGLLTLDEYLRELQGLNIEVFVD